MRGFLHEINVFDQMGRENGLKLYDHRDLGPGDCMHRDLRWVVAISECVRA